MQREKRLPVFLRCLAAFVHEPEAYGKSHD